jgi:hypothetical protein
MLEDAHPVSSAGTLLAGVEKGPHLWGSQESSVVTAEVCRGNCFCHMHGSGET